MRIDVIVIDGGRPSNAPAHAIGGLLGQRDVAPLDFLAGARAQLAELPSVRMMAGEAARVEADRTVTLEDGTTLAARAVVLATGMDYAVPDVPGIAELWGTSVVHCPFCHGWEARDARIGVLSAGPEHLAHIPPLLRRLSADVTVFEGIAELRSDGGTLRAVVRPDGTEVPCDVLFVAAPPAPRDAAFAHLAPERTGPGLLAVDLFGATSVPGIRAAGDLVTPGPAVVHALASGQRAAVGIVRELAEAA
jgi:thioredoxin reductase (NADPH)